MSEQLEVWQGEFGDAYTERNQPDPASRRRVFQEILGDIRPRAVLEVGCNRGHNLVALRDLLGVDVAFTGVEPNQTARKHAEASESGLVVLAGQVAALPFEDKTFDLVFTCGVLIHVALADLPKAIKELHRCTRRYLLTLDYFAEEETPILYRGRPNLLWKRNFRKHFEQVCQNLHLIREGYLGPEQGFDRTNWWLWERSDCE